MMTIQAPECENENKDLAKMQNDAIIAVEYIVRELNHHKVHELAQILTDVTQVYRQGQQNQNQAGTNDIGEYNSILYTYFIQKYYANIKLSSYKNKILDFFKNEIKNSEN